MAAWRKDSKQSDRSKLDYGSQQKSDSQLSYESSLNTESSIDYEHVPVVQLVVRHDDLFHTVCIGLGFSSTVGGFVLTMGSSTLAPVAGGALISTGLAAFLKGCSGLQNNTKVDLREFVIDLTLAAVTGGVASGVSHAIEAHMATEAFLQKSLQEGIKLGTRKLIFRCCAHGGLGVFMTATNEMKLCIRNEKRWIDFGQSLEGGVQGTILLWFSGAVSGALSGAAFHGANNVSHLFKFEKGLEKGVLRVSLSAMTGATANALDQSWRVASGRQQAVELSELVLNALFAAGVTATGEATKNAVYFINGGKLNYLNRLAINKDLDKEFVSDALASLDTLGSIDETRLRELYEKARQYSTDLGQQNETIRQFEQSIEAMNQELASMADRLKSSLVENSEKKLINQGLKFKKESLKETTLAFTKFKQEQLINKDNYAVLVTNHRNAHFLAGDGAGLFAVDFNLTGLKNGDRGMCRLVFDVLSESGRLKFAYRGYIDDHDYGKLIGKGRNELLLNKLKNNNLPVQPVASKCWLQ